MLSWYSTLISLSVTVLNQVKFVTEVRLQTKKNANNRSEEHWRFSKDEGHKLGGNALQIKSYAALQRKSRLTLRKEI